MDYIIALFIWLFGLDVDATELQQKDVFQPPNAKIEVRVNQNPLLGNSPAMHMNKLPNRQRNHIIAVDDTHFRVDL